MNNSEKKALSSEEIDAIIRRQSKAILDSMSQARMNYERQPVIDEEEVNSIKELMKKKKDLEASLHDIKGLSFCMMDLFMGLIKDIDTMINADELLIAEEMIKDYKRMIFSIEKHIPVLKEKYKSLMPKE